VKGGGINEDECGRRRIEYWSQVELYCVLLKENKAALWFLSRCAWAASKLSTPNDTNANV